MVELNCFLGKSDNVCFARKADVDRKKLLDIFKEPSDNTLEGIKGFLMKILPEKHASDLAKVLFNFMNYDPNINPAVPIVIEIRFHLGKHFIGIFFSDRLCCLCSSRQNENE